MLAVAGLPESEAVTTVANEANTIATITRVSQAVFCTPIRLTAVNATTAPTASGRAWSSDTYAPNVSAIAAQLAVFPTTNAQPARNPQPCPSRRRP